MRSEIVTNFVEFIKHTEVFDFINDLTVFRGQPIQGNLIPSVARAEVTLNTTSREKNQLADLRLLGASLLPSQEANDLDLMVRAQHFGLKTRLLDWTSNPLAALWFACTDACPGDVYVYALEADNFLAEDVYNDDPFKAGETCVFQPRLNNARIIAQHGWFTLHRYSADVGRFIAVEANPKMEGNLTEFKIPPGSRTDVLRSLDRHGINSRSIFPDLQGLCGYLNWRDERL